MITVYKKEKAPENYMKCRVQLPNYCSMQWDLGDPLKSIPLKKA